MVGKERLKEKQQAGHGVPPALYSRFWKPIDLTHTVNRIFKNLNSERAGLVRSGCDLEGNVIWYYAIQPLEPFPMKLLPNGHMLAVFSGVAIQEIDLAGDIISQITQDRLQNGLTAAGLPIQANSVPNANHDILKLDNGHWVFIVSFNQTLSDGNMVVTGNAVVDWDPQLDPVWTWSTFDHLSLTHAPFGTSDWTHANAVIYSPDDGNLIPSIGNQNWIVKIKYQDGTGHGSVLWRPGPEVDFALPSGQPPIEWNYGQHYPVLLGRTHQAFSR